MDDLTAVPRIAFTANRLLEFCTVAELTKLIGFDPELQFLVSFGNALDRSPHYLVEGTKHYTNLFVVLVGDTSKSRKDADDDGRPLVVFTLSDCDPAGHQMPVSIGRKFQALRDLLFSKLRFEVVPVALTVEQVRDLGLPSTPLKETEKRADRWREAFGVEQTEIDALATLQSDVLREIVERAFDPYFDRTLESRVAQAEEDWGRLAQEAVAEQIDPEQFEALRTEAAERLSELEDAIASINERLRLVAADHFELPPIEVPEPEVDEETQRQALGQFGPGWHPSRYWSPKAREWERNAYPTPDWVTAALAEHIDFRGRTVWEPACGDGRMAEALKSAGAGSVLCSDTVNYGYPLDAVLDFTAGAKPGFDFDGIITNPAYGWKGKTAEQFIEAGLRHIAGGGFLALLLSADFDSATTRPRFFRDCSLFAAKIVLTRPIVWFSHPDPKKERPNENNAWYVWARLVLRAAPITLYAPRNASPSFPETATDGCRHQRR